MTTRKQEKTAVLGANRPELVISFLGGAEPGSVRVDRDKIRGRLRLREFFATRLHVQEFVNCPEKDPVSICAFTQCYGPLHAQRGTEFSFDIRDWRSAQRRMQAEWDMCRLPGTVRLLADPPSPFPLEPGHSLIFERGQALLRAHNLLEFLRLELALWNPAALRICPNPDCPRPFFIKAKNTSVYCDREECKLWGKNGSNLRGWHRNKHRYN